MDKTGDEASRDKFEIGFLGYGRMARAISAGLAENGLIPFSRQIVSGRDRTKLEKAAGDHGLTVAAGNRDLARRCRVLVLGVKPDQVVPALEEIRAETPDRLIISLAAGVGLETMRRILPPGAALVRSMPNVAALARAGVTLICALPGSGPEHLAQARRIFESVGLCWELEEKLFDAAGALSGSGPAYFFTIMESLVRGGVRLGLPWDLAKELALFTALGSSQMAWRQKDRALADLRDMVTSPGGATAEALLVMESKALGGILQEALAAAAEKSKKLG